MHDLLPLPKFSIITLTYNAGKVLGDTIKSMVNQSYENAVYMIVVGGFIHGTLTIINK